MSCAKGAELKKADIQVSAADMTVAKATTVEVADSAGLKSNGERGDNTVLYAVGALGFVTLFAVLALASWSSSGSKTGPATSSPVDIDVEEDLELTGDEY